MKLRNAYKLLWAIFEGHAKRLPPSASLDFGSIKERFKRLHKGKSFKKKVKHLARIMSMQMGVDPYACVSK